MVYILYKCNDTDDVDGISAQSTMVPYLPCLCTRVYPQQLTIYTSYLTLPYLPINTVCNCTYKDRFSTQIQIIFFFFFIRVPEYKFEQCKSRSGKMCKVQRYLDQVIKGKMLNNFCVHQNRVERRNCIQTKTSEKKHPRAGARVNEQRMLSIIKCL